MNCTKKITINEIREDLKEIRYYYSRKESMEEAFSQTGKNKVIEKVERYNKIASLASPKLYDVYVNLYINNYTQEGLSIELNYTPEYIQMLNKKLLVFICEKINHD